MYVNDGRVRLVGMITIGVFIIAALVGGADSISSEPLNGVRSRGDRSVVARQDSLMSVAFVETQDARHRVVSLRVDGGDVSASLGRDIAQAYPWLRRLEIQNHGVSDDTLRGISELRMLNYLSIGSEKLTGDCLREIGKLKDLEHLELNGTVIRGEALSHLSGLQFLRCLRISSPHVQDSHLTHLSRLFRLQYLDLSSCEVTAQGLANAPVVGHVAELRLPFAIEGKEAIPVYRSAKRLERVTLYGCTDDLLVALESLPRLSKLEIYRGSIGDRGVGSMERHACLRRLMLSDVQMVGPTKWFPKLEALVDVHVAGEGLRPEFFEAMSGNRRIRYLTVVIDAENDLDATCVTASSLQAIAKIPDLEFLEISGVKEMDFGLVGKISNLRGLGIRSDIEFNPENVKTLASLKHLNEVYFRLQKSAELERARPDLYWHDDAFFMGFRVRDEECCE